MICLISNCGRVNAGSNGAQPNPAPWLRLLSVEIKQQFEEELGAHGVTVGQWAVLVDVYKEAPDTIDQVVQSLGVTPERVRELITELSERSLLVTRPDCPGEPDCGPELLLTPAGAALAPVLVAIAERIDARIFDALETEQRDRLEECVNRLLAIAHLPAGGPHDDR
jgi:DNA-binding MarR family transcriptional regulator